nr:G protein-coupled receptor [Proales similis]
MFSRVCTILLLYFIVRTRSENGTLFLSVRPMNSAIIAAPKTLASRQTLNFTVEVDTTTIDFALSFVWSIVPADLHRFEQVEGLGLIEPDKNETQVQIKAIDSFVSQMDTTGYQFILDQVNLFSLPPGVQVFISPTRSFANFGLLPSNYPFGLFRFSQAGNITVSKYQIQNNVSSIRIVRNAGTSGRVLVAYEQVDLRLNRRLNQYVEFESGQTEADLALGDLLSATVYPIQLRFLLSSAQLRQNPSQLDLNDALVREAHDILPGVISVDLFVNVIDERAFIEFDSLYLFKAVELAVDQRFQLAFRIKVEQSTLSHSVVSALVRLVAIPFEGLVGDTNCSKAVPYVHFYPEAFSLSMQANSSDTWLQITVFNADYSYTLSRCLGLRIVRLDGCDACAIGINDQANIVLKKPAKLFKGLVKLLNVDENLQLSVQMSGDRAVREVCMRSQSEKPINISLDQQDQTTELGFFKLEVVNSPLSLKANQAGCVLIRSLTAGSVKSNYCFNHSVAFQLSIRYSIGREFKLVSNQVAYEPLTVLFFNTNCTKIEADVSRLKSNGLETQPEKRNGSFVVSLEADKSVHDLELPVTIQNNHATFYLFKSIVQIDFDVGIRQHVEYASSQAFVDSQPSQIRFRLQRVDALAFYELKLRISFTAQEAGLFESGPAQGVSLVFIIKSGQPAPCAVISLDPFRSGFTLDGDQRRSLVIVLNNSSPRQSDSCLQTALLSIDRLNSSEPIEALFENQAVNFAHEFDTNQPIIKVIKVRSDAILNPSDHFLIRLDSVQPIGLDGPSYIRSIEASYLRLRPNELVSNGQVQIDTSIGYSIDSTGRQLAKLNTRISRDGLFNSIRISFDLLILDPFVDKYVKLNQEPVEQLLTNSQTQAAFQVDLDHILAQANSYGTLFFFTSICYLNSSQVNDCSPIQGRLPIKASGIAQISSESNELVLAQEQTGHSIVVDRKLGALDSAQFSSSIVYAQSVYPHAVVQRDQVLFNRTELSRNVPLKLNAFYRKRPLEAFFVLAPSDQSSLVLKTAQTILLRLDTNEFRDVLAFSQKSITVTFVRSNRMPLEVFIRLQKFGLVSAQSREVRVTTIGFDSTLGSSMPTYIQADLVKRGRSSLDLAVPGIDFEPIERNLKLASQQTDIALKVFTNGTAAQDWTKFVYLDLRAVNAVLLAPDQIGTLSPFVCIQLKPVEFVNDEPLSVQIGFSSQLVSMKPMNETERKNLSISLQVDSARKLADNPIEFVQVRIEATLLNSSASELFKSIDQVAECAAIVDDQFGRQCLFLVNCGILEANCSFELPLRSNLSIYVDHHVELSLSPIQITGGYFAQFVSTAVSDQSRTMIVRLEQNGLIESTIGFVAESKLILTSRLDLYALLHVETQGADNVTIQFRFRTEQEPNEEALNFNGLELEPAVPDYDFVSANQIMSIESNQTNSFKIDLLDCFPQDFGSFYDDSQHSVDGLQAKYFKVKLTACSPNCAVRANSSTAVVVILLKNLPMWHAYKRAIDDDAANANRLLLERSIQAARLESDELILLENTLSQQTERLEQMSSNEINELVEVFCNFMSPQRDELAGHLTQANLLESVLLASSQRADQCTDQLSRVNMSEFKCDQFTFAYKCVRVNSSETAISFAGHLFSVEFYLPPQVAGCVDLCAAEFHSSSVSASESLFHERSLIVASRTGDRRQPIRHKFQLLLPNAVQTGKKCGVFVDSNVGWDTSACRTRILSTGIECECQHNSLFGVVRPDKSRPFGYDFNWLYAALAFNIFASLLALVSQLLFVSAYTHRLVIFLQPVVANTIVHILYLILIAYREWFTADTEPYGSNVNCTVISLLFHLFILAQFSSMLSGALVAQHDRQFTFRHAASFLIVCWLLPLVLLGLFYLIAHHVYANILHLSASFIYAPVIDDGALCFVKNIWFFLLGLVFPALLMASIALARLITAIMQLNSTTTTGCVSIDERQRPNLIRSLLYWSLVIACNSLGAVHIRTGHLWAFVLFCVLEFGQGTYLIYMHIFRIHIWNLVRNEMIKSSGAQRKRGHLLPQREQGGEQPSQSRKSRHKRPHRKERARPRRPVRRRQPKKSESSGKRVQIDNRNDDNRLDVESKLNVTVTSRGENKSTRAWIKHMNESSGSGPYTYFEADASELF